MKSLGIALLVVGLLAAFGWMGWALMDMGGLKGITGGSTTIAVMVAAGVGGTALLAGVLMRLAFWSSKKGYDEALRFESRDDGGMD